VYEELDQLKELKVWVGATLDTTGTEEDDRTTDELGAEDEGAKLDEPEA
jgi:hypothetical protein